MHKRITHSQKNSVISVFPSLSNPAAALAVAGRAAFYWLPQCKPVCAIVILTAVAFTPEAGFVTGAAAG